MRGIDRSDRSRIRISVRFDESLLQSTAYLVLPLPHLRRALLQGAAAAYPAQYSGPDKLAPPQSAHFEFTANPLTFAHGSTQTGPPHESVCWELTAPLFIQKRVAEKLCKRLAGRTCAAMKRLHQEGSEWMGEDAETEVMDAGTSRRPSASKTLRWLEYGTVQTLANLLGEKEAAEPFTLRLNEERAADKKLSSLQNRSMLKQRLKGFLQASKTAIKESVKLPAKSLLAGSVRSGTSGIIWRGN